MGYGYDPHPAARPAIPPYRTAAASRYVDSCHLAPPGGGSSPRHVQRLHARQPVAVLARDPGAGRRGRGSIDALRVDDGRRVGRRVIDVAFTPSDARAADVAVVIDVLRATTTATPELASGYP